MIRTWLNPPTPAFPAPVTDPRERRGIVVELVIVFAITLGLSALRSLLSLVDSLLREERLADQAVALNVSQATNQLLDFLRQLVSATQLFAWGVLGLYLPDQVLSLAYYMDFAFGAAELPLPGTDSDTSAEGEAGPGSGGQKGRST